MSYEAWGDGDDSPYDAAIEAGWINPHDQSKALIDVMNERLRQVNEKGWSAEHDDQHTGGELARLAAAYALGECEVAQLPGLYICPPGWFKPKDRRFDLVRAAALLLAEIEIFDRAAQNEVTPANCPVCDMPFKSFDLCATDIELGTCHAACVDGSTIVDLHTGEVTGGTIVTFRYEDNVR
ncbi:hypothetical protein [Agrobacterium vitis]|uniref:hypothetical protein n=1 Tax=Agrobacterium vitis TaxID=373 RepID=UPI001F2D8FAD|nr:hypothetical protein [Agrobacterium vitis]